MGGSCTRVSRPGTKEPGAPEGAPRTAAITRHCRHKKNACNGELGAGAPLSKRAAKPGRRFCGDGQTIAPCETLCNPVRQKFHASSLPTGQEGFDGSAIPAHGAPEADGGGKARRLAPAPPGGAADFEMLAELLCGLPGHGGRRGLLHVGLSSDVEETEGCKGLRKRGRRDNVPVRPVRMLYIEALSHASPLGTLTGQPGGRGRSHVLSESAPVLPYRGFFLSADYAEPTVHASSPL